MEVLLEGVRMGFKDLEHWGQAGFLRASTTDVYSTVLYDDLWRQRVALL